MKNFTNKKILILILKFKHRQNVINDCRLRKERKQLDTYKMSKRPLSSNVNINPKPPKQSKNWSLGLLESMNNPDLIIKKTNNCVVIKDKYPKAKLHYLVLPYADIKTIYNLDNSHLDLLNEFKSVFEDIRRENRDLSLRAGFHAIPSMLRLHMHILSTDMISPCMKNKKHWNSFNTTFFKPYNEVLEELKLNGHIKKISNEEHKALLSAPLKCNQCSYAPKNMPMLKEHLITHLNKNQ